MRIILGLGNPGPRYARSRHNVGFLAAERLAGTLRARFRTEGDVAEVARGRASGEDLIVARPLTFMNGSGRAAKELSARHEVGPEGFIVVFDDVALPLGRLRLRESGTAGGHKGMQSVIDWLGTTEIPRLRMGILGGAEPERREEDLAEFVLREFEPGEWPEVDKMVERASDALLLAIGRGIGVAASRFNRAEETPGAGEGPGG